VKRIIIDTDPGVDDSMAILLAFNSPELVVEGITTVFGNTGTQCLDFTIIPRATLSALFMKWGNGRFHIFNHVTIMIPSHCSK